MKTKNLMKLKVIIGIIIAIIGMSFASCSENYDFGETPLPRKVPTNKEDSLIIVNVYKAMGCDNWPGFDKKALRLPELWRIAGGEWGRYYDEDKGEFRITKLIIELSYFPISEDIEEIVLPEEIGNLDQLKQIKIIGSKNTKIRIPASIFKSSPYYFYVDSCSFENDRITDEISMGAIHLKDIDIRNSNIVDINFEVFSEFRSLRGISLYGNCLSGKVPLDETRELRDKGIGINLENNYYSSIDWSFFTNNPYELDDRLPYLNGNCFSGEIPEEVFYTRKWCAYGDRMHKMREGYGFWNYRCDDWAMVQPK